MQFFSHDGWIVAGVTLRMLDGQRAFYGSFYWFENANKSSQICCHGM